MNKIGRYTLQQLEEKDLIQILEWRNGDHVKQYMYTDHTITWEEHARWYEKTKEDSTQKVLLLFYEDKPIGLVSFKQIDEINSHCYWGFYIGDLTAPKGSGTALGILALDYMFKKAGVEKVHAEVIETNVRSYHFHEKLGFAYEGKLIEPIYKNGQYVDVLKMGLIAEKWFQIRGKLVKQLKEGWSS